MAVSDKDFELMYADLDNKTSDVQRAYFLRNKAREANLMSDSRSSYLLMYIWEIYIRSLWKIQWEGDIQYESLRKWVDGQIGSVYSGANSENTLADVVRVTTRIFNYANQSNIRDKNNIPITPKYLIKNIGIGRLKIVSNRFLDSIQSNIRDEILVALTLDNTDSELKVLYTKPRIARIHYAEYFHSDSGTDVIIFGLDEKQISAFRNALQKIATRHHFPLAVRNREAILKLLPPNAGQQKLFDMDDYDGDDETE